MRYYVYVSDAKVDMLLAQISDGTRKKIAQELSIDLKVLKLSHKQEIERTENRFKRLEVVEKYINANEWCGPLDEGHPYIYDTLPFRWGRLSREVKEAESSHIVRPDAQSPVLFSLNDRNRALDLLMTGSPRHLVGAAPSGTPIEYRESSSTPGLGWFVQSYYAGQFDDADKETTRLTFGGHSPPSGSQPIPSEMHQALTRRYQPISKLAELTLNTDAWMHQLAYVRSKLRWLPPQRLEFLARRLSKYEGGSIDLKQCRVNEARPLILASPIFVALA